MRRCKLFRDQRGVAAMEFALVAPVLLFILFATIEYGWYMVQSIVLTNAVAESARIGVRAREWDSAFSDAQDPEDFARAILEKSLWVFSTYPESYVDIDILDEDSNHPRRLQVKISDLPYKPITCYIGAALLPETLAAKAVLALP